MKGQFKPVLKSISEEPIKLPGSPFWNVFKRFGRDEAIAMLINVLGTALMALATANAFILAITGPIIEKLGFFPAHFKEALNIYRTTPEKQRRSFFFYVKKAFKGGTKSLLEDLLVHDPAYILLMFVGLKAYSQTPIWLLASASFILALVIVTFAEVAFTEICYLNFKRQLKAKGFGLETYYESRFFISSNIRPDKVLNTFVKAFNLKSVRKFEYHDLYFENKLPEYSGRSPRIRLRKRSTPEKSVQTAQVIYTRAYEMSKKKLDQCRYFPIKKEKIYSLLEQKMPDKIEDIKNREARVFLKKVTEKIEPRTVRFVRMLAYDEELMVSADKVHGKDPFFLLELKVYRDKKLLKEAMRFAMREFPVVQTTHGKRELIFR